MTDKHIHVAVDGTRTEHDASECSLTLSYRMRRESVSGVIHDVSPTDSFTDDKGKVHWRAGVKHE